MATHHGYTVAVRYSKLLVVLASAVLLSVPNAAHNKMHIVFHILFDQSKK